MDPRYSVESAPNKRAVYEGWLLGDPTVPQHYVTALASSYNDFRAMGPLLVVTVVPDRAEMTFIPQRFDPAKALSPIEDEIGIAKDCVGSFISYWPSADGHWAAAAQLTYNGGIYTVRNTTSRAGGQLNFIGYEDFIARSVRRYVDCLRDRSVFAPLYVGISLLRVQSYRRSDGEMSAAGGIRDNIRPDMVVIPARARLPDVAAAATVLRRAFRQIRRDLMTPDSFSYDPASVPQFLSGVLFPL